MNSKPDICIYHSPCQDGFTAAWCIWQKWPDIEFFPGVYGEAPPDVTGKNVLIVDFSYKRPVLEELAGLARTITVIDHHKSAEADLEAFRVKDRLALNDFREVGLGAAFLGRPPIQAWFDMNQSGAMMAWQYANGDAPAPMLVQHVQDRDLWRFDLPYTREICANLFSLDYSFEEWCDAADDLASDPAGFRRAGEAIERKHHKDVVELLSLCTRDMVIGGETVLVANLPYTLSSDGANKLAESARFGACYYDNSEGKRVFSLRSKPEGADVSEIAVKYGGGGHARAAGFSAPLGWEGDT